ncbi:MAG: endo-1,4-beta-xylanase [Hyphomicrobium sp.]
MSDRDPLSGDGLNRLSRRTALKGAGAAALVLTTAATTPASQSLAASKAEAMSLAALAAEKGLLFGASFSVAELDQPDGARYGALYQRHARVLTSELEFKMHTLSPTAEQMDFGPADRLMAFARDNVMKVRGHTLIWNDYLPDWAKTLSPRDAEKLIETHLTKVLDRYRGQVFEWDVVNEPIGPWDRLPGNLRGGLFLTALGERYIDRSFELAARLDPGARLFLNEAQTETADDNGRVFRESFLALVRRLRDRNVPLTGVGLQCHLNSGAPYDVDAFAKYLEQFAALGLEISITELDCNDKAFPPLIATRDRRVADLYRRFLDAALSVKAVKTLTTWQLMDEKNWIWYADVEKNPSARRRPRPLLFDSDYQPKPAFYAVADALKAMPSR